jgi:histidinol dehydrogenase
MLTIVKAGSAALEKRLAAISQRADGEAAKVRGEVRSLLDDIFARKEAAVNDISLRFDKLLPREIPRPEWENAASECSPEILDDLRRAAKNIEDYQSRLIPKSGEWQTPDGGTAGVQIRPVERAGLYVPGGTSAYPSTVLMTAIPARAACVGELIICSPPGEQLKPEVLAAALICGADRVFAIGGVPAIASMALGLGIVPRCDVVAGPGNAYVTEAKRQLYGYCGIDSTAGPSDILLLCDHTANAAWAAADLLSQAEHGSRSRAVLVSTDESAARSVCSELKRQIGSLPRGEEAALALTHNSIAIIAPTKDEALGIVNRLAPEHLQIITENPGEWLPGVRNAGAVFLGAYSPEPLGDYWAGPSHVLPTEGGARFFSPVSAETFLKRISTVSYDKSSFLPISENIARLARAEGLEAHARSAEVRKI